MIKSDERISKEILKKIHLKAFSKIPIYDKHNKNKIIGILKAKSLVGIIENYEGSTFIQTTSLQTPILISQDTSLLELLTIFQNKRSTVALIMDENLKNTEVYKKNPRFQV